MARTNSFRVLWIEDDPNFKESFIKVAKTSSIEMVHFEDWESASSYLNQYIDEIDSVILDAHCKINRGESAGNDDFLHIAVVGMLLIFAKHHTVRPWYVLSAGTMDRFSKVTSVIESYRKDYEPEWGEMVYTKTKPRVFDSTFSDEFGNADSGMLSESDLLDKIKDVCSKHFHNSALARHRDTLKYLGTHSVIKGNARKLLLQLLSAMYDPQKFVGFPFTGNPIRRIFECIVRSGVEYGLIPDEVCKGGNVKCMEASRFLGGDNPEMLSYRFGDVTESVLSAIERSMLITILTSTNVGSHETSEDYAECDVALNEDNRDEYCGCALLMCRIIKAVGKYIETHNNVENNQKRWKHNPRLLEGKELVVESAAGILHAGNCLLPDKSWLHEGMKVRLTEVVFNNSETSDAFQFFSKNPQSVNR